MIHEVDESLRRLLFGELTREKGSAITDPGQITFLPPATLEEHPPKQPQINLYLHDVTENIKMREHERSLATRPADSETVTRRRAPVRLDLGYLVSVYASDTGVEHRLLTEVLGVFLRSAVLPARYLTETIAAESGGNIILAVAQPDHAAHQDAPRLWQALGGRLRPTLGLTATAAFNPFETRTTRLVREAILALGPGIPPNPVSVKTTRVSAAGIVCDKDGRELPGVTVEAKGFDKTVTTNDRGFFHLLDLHPGRMTLVFRRKNYRTLEIPTNVPPAGRPDLLEPLGVTLESLEDTERIQEARQSAKAALNAPGLVESGRELQIGISGRLAYHSGKPAAFVVVKAGVRETTTDGDGFYAFTNLKEKVTSLIAVVPGVGEVTVTPSDKTTVLAASSEGEEKPSKAKR